MTDATALDGAVGGDAAALATLLEDVPVGLVVAKAPDGGVLFGNREARRLLLLGDEASVAREIVPLGGFHPRGRRYAPGESPVERVLHAGEVVQDELVELELAGGSRRLVSLTASPVRDATGTIVAGVVLVTDMTTRGRRERAERDFITNAAHELQTPIAAIVSAVEVLQSGAKQRPADRDRFLSHIENAAARLERLTRALLVLARAETADEFARREIVELAPLLRSVAASHGSSERITVRCAPNVATVANRELLEQALFNLVDNALRHSEGRGVMLRARRSAQRVAVEVSDNGRGIPEAERHVVFERFYRGEHGGFGIGLSIVRAAVTALGGDVEIESSDAGTTVRITLPPVRIVRR